MEKIYDMIIIGGGPGGYTAAMYGARAGLKVLLLERLAAGGQMALTHQIDNYPGFEDGIDGFALAEKMQKQAHRFGAESVFTQVKAVKLNQEPKVIETGKGTYYGRTVVIATGADPRRLGLPEEDALIGRGVAYCAACDGMFYRGKTVAVVGGGNSAAADALLLSRVAEKVILIHRRDSLRATKIYHDPLEQAQNVEFYWNSQVKEILQDGKVTGAVLQDVKTGQQTRIDCDGLFVSIGRKPATQLFEGQLELDEGGYILAQEDTKTSIPGVFAVGDVRSKPVRQIVTATADGAIAVHMAEAYFA